MKHIYVFAFVVGAFCSGSSVAMAQSTPSSIGIVQTGAGIQPKFNPEIQGLLNEVADRQKSFTSAEEKHESQGRKTFYLSVAALLASTTFDAASSWHKSEANPLLASGNGTFGGKAAGIKIGLAGVALLPQIIFRRDKNLRKGFIVENFAVAGVYSAVGLHNLGVGGR